MAPLHGRCTAKRGRNSTARTEDGDKSLDSSPNAHTAAGQASDDIDQTRQALSPALLEATSPSLPAFVVTSGDASVRVEALTGQLSGLLDGPAKVEHAGERVSEVDHKEGADERDDTGDVGHGSCDDEGEDPVARAKAVPCDSALASGDWREAEDLLEDLEVDSLHADIEVHDCEVLAMGTFYSPTGKVYAATSCRDAVFS